MSSAVFITQLEICEHWSYNQEWYQVEIIRFWAKTKYWKAAPGTTGVYVTEIIIQHLLYRAWTDSWTAMQSVKVILWNA